MRDSVKCRRGKIYYSRFEKKLDDVVVDCKKRRRSATSKRRSYLRHRIGLEKLNAKRAQPVSILARDCPQ